MTETYEDRCYRVENEGYEFGSLGGIYAPEKHNPYPANSEDHFWWSVGYDDAADTHDVNGNSIFSDD